MPDTPAAPHNAPVRTGASADHRPDSVARHPLSLGRLGRADVLAVPADDGRWGLAIQGPGRASLLQDQPVQIDLWDEQGIIRHSASGYTVLEITDGICHARAELAASHGASFLVEDRWTVVDETLTLARTVTVQGSAPGGFLSAITFLLPQGVSFVDVAPFAPGMLYGDTAYVTGVAIGGVDNYLNGVRHIRIREDRLPAPLFGLFFGDGTSFTVFNPLPQGDTTAADAHDVAAVPLVDERFRFGALGCNEHSDRMAIGYWFPGTEGETTYRGDTFPGGQMRRWRHRYHPVIDGLVQQYTLVFRLGHDDTFVDYRTRVWRRAWEALRPGVIPHDIAQARSALIAMLADSVVRVGDKAGVPLAVDAVTGRVDERHRRAFMGFTGRSVESGYFLLRAADRTSGRESERYRGLGLAILESFAALPASPPVAEGFSLVDGQPADHLGDLMFLRSLCEGAAYMLRAWRHERGQGRDHPGWVAWSRRLTDWLLARQYPNGGFPRAWHRDGRDLDRSSPESSYNAIPLLVLWYQVTEERAYLDAALRTGEFCWTSGQCKGVFIGGTIDNPNVIDKEAGTISLDAYLALYEVTGDERWLRRAIAAGDYAETWIYLWTVPMADDDDDHALHWKKGVPTAGLQLIASGHSLVDAYMAWDVASYARLYRLTGDAHYLDVARLLLHNTKTMLALPGRTYDLAGPGWQQEHWSLAPRRGYGIHRLWLPWVTCSHLWGIERLEEDDPSLFETLARGV